MAQAKIACYLLGGQQRSAPDGALLLETLITIHLFRWRASRAEREINQSGACRPINACLGAASINV
jgi:hypothetical protein